MATIRGLDPDRLSTQVLVELERELDTVDRSFRSNPNAGSDIQNAKWRAVSAAIVAHMHTYTQLVDNPPRQIEFSNQSTLTVEHTGPVRIYDDAGSQVTGEELRSGRLMTVTFVVPVTGTMYLL